MMKNFKFFYKQNFFVSFKVTPFKRLLKLNKVLISLKAALKCQSYRSFRRKIKSKQVAIML